MSLPRKIADGWYHSALRVLVVCFAAILVFESGVLSPATKTIAHLAGEQMASVIRVSTDVTPYSIQQVQTERTQTSTVPEPISKSTFLLSTLLFVLLLLLVLNYVLVHLRTKELQYYLSHNA